MIFLLLSLAYNSILFSNDINRATFIYAAPNETIEFDVDVASLLFLRSIHK